MILRLDPPIPLDTPKGAALAYFLLDYSADHHLFWICFIEATGECWTFDNTQIRMQKNFTMGIRIPKNSSNASE